MPRVVDNRNPLVRYAPYVTQAARVIFGNNIRPFERAVLNAGPGLAVAAAESLWNTYQNYQQASDSISRAYDKSDYLYQPEKTGTDTAVEPPYKRPRISLLGGRGHTGGNAPSASAAQQSTEYREQLPDAQLPSSAIVRHFGGSSSRAPMVRRIYAGRRMSRRRGRFPGNVFRRSYRGGWSGLSSFARKRRLFRPERKALDRNLGGVTRAGGIFFQSTVNIKEFSTTNSPTAGSSANGFSMVEINQGTGLSERIGNQITVTNMMVRGCIKTPTTNGDTPAYNNCVTVMIVQDRQANGAIPAVSDILVASTYTDPSTSMRNLENRSRFKILAKRQMILIGGTNANTYYFEMSVKKPIKIIYNGTGSGYTNVRTNQIWFLCFDNLGASVADPITANASLESVYARTRFIDP